MRAPRLVFVVFLSALLLVPPVSSSQGKGQGQGRGGKERVERVEKDRGEKRGQGQRAEKRRGGERERGQRAERGRSGEPRREQKAREARVDRRERQRAELREQRQRVEVRERQGRAEVRERTELRERHRLAELREDRRRAELREQRRVAELREQRREALRAQRQAEQRLRERESARLSRLVTSVRERRDDDRFVERVRFRDRDLRTARGPMRFRGLDRDGDGRIGRREWRGNGVSFRNHDWNGDGILSGAEVTPGAGRPLRFDRFDDRVRVFRRDVRLDPIFTFRSDRFGHRVVLPPAPLVTRVDRAFLAPAPVRYETFRPARRVAPGYYYPYRDRDDVLVLDLGLDLDDRFGLLALPATLMLADALVDDVDVVVRSGRFAAFDSDLDGYVTPVEWPLGRRSFSSYDRDGDLLLVRDELYYDDDLLYVDRDRFLLFHGLDRDDDGLIAPWEWPGDLDSFFLRDFNGDAVIGLDEFMGLVEVDYGVRDYGFDVLDFDGGGTITRVEWVGDPVRFTHLDRNDNGVVGRWEYGVGWVLDV